MKQHVEVYQLTDKNGYENFHVYVTLKDINKNNIIDFDMPCLSKDDNGDYVYIYDYELQDYWPADTNDYFDYSTNADFALDFFIEEILNEWLPQHYEDFILNFNKNMITDISYDYNDKYLNKNKGE